MSERLGYVRPSFLSAIFSKRQKCQRLSPPTAALVMIENCSGSGVGHSIGTSAYSPGFNEGTIPSFGTVPPTGIFSTVI